ncbi:hypothetical protein BK120_02530 [Paenibacillus sp. FSL A5-0031]|uniref:DUF4166 domain-containing protein n=1 Tax=Paenibacillus sp. FSL A5-0031 TaxID=1920420 RepID=UPI00096BE3C1|nr:DUF4166 domain-containing protein [Paenibacillus sp. FSL A5-0031]OME88207.1 hypothetical protein BK120_02530 [Paenibacillus sp. FSL A5-0031]
MRSIYEQALGADFQKLHPRIQKRFGFCSQDRTASIGHGVMQLIWYNKLAALPLFIGTLRHIMFPQGGVNIPFSIENYAYVDAFGRETVTWIRKFKFPRTIRHFDATMVYSGEREVIVDYLGNKQHLAVDLDVAVSTKGGIRIISGEQRFYEGWLQFRFPRLFTGRAEVNEWYDDEERCYKISVDVRNPILGQIFRYEGSFQASFVNSGHEAIPIGIRPLREEKRE